MRHKRSRPPISHEREILHVAKIDDNVLWGAAGKPPQFFRRAHVDLKTRYKRRYEHEIALGKIDKLGIVFAEINAGASCGLMPAKVFVKPRARVTAGLANEVDAVNQYAEVM